MTKPKQKALAIARDIAAKNAGKHGHKFGSFAMFFARAHVLRSHMKFSAFFLFDWIGRFLFWRLRKK